MKTIRIENVQEAMSILVDLPYCFLQAPFGESCRIKMEKVASP